MQPHRHILSALILCSGFSALIYEITWTRHLSLLFGSNMLAVGTVTATFMAGLAIGSLWIGRRTDRHAAPLRLYALLEAGIAITALLFPLSLDLLTRVFIPLAQGHPDGAGLIAAARFTLTALALLPPTVCMGGTLPVVCRFLAAQQLDRLVGRLYALNTLGAVAGCLTAGFLLIPQLGMSATQAIAIAVNLLIAVTAWRLDRPERPVHNTASTPAVPQEHAGDKPPTALLLGAAALLGAMALAFEMLWTRLLLLFLGNTTYAFATILGAFLTGLTLGGALYAHYLARRARPALTYFALLAAMLLCVLGSLPAYDRLGFLFEAIHRQAADRWWFLAFGSFLAVSLVVMVPAMLSGALFPATVRLLQAERAHFGSLVGRVLFWNTLGAMAGSFLGVFAIAQVGLQNSFKLIALTGLLLAALFLRRYRDTLPLRPATVPLALGTLLMLVPAGWDQGLMNSGIYVYSHYYLNSGGLGSPRTTTQPVEVVEGLETTAAFFRSPDGYKEFRVNGKSDGGTRPGDMKTQVLLGQLPMLFHPAPQTALVIGLGTGITLRQVLDYPVKDVECAEISPEVVAIARHFAEESEEVLSAERVKLLIRDGRNLLLTRDTTYDVIISEPSNPWQTGNANLFTREFYRLATSRLNPGGLFCQWLPLYDLPTANLQIALQTFADSFAAVRVFLLGGDMILLGSDAPLPSEPQLPRSPEQARAVLTHLALAGLDSPQQLLERYAFADARFLKAAAGQAPLNTDDLPHLEFTRQTGLDLSRLNLRYLVSVRQQLGTAASP